MREMKQNSIPAYSSGDHSSSWIVPLRFWKNREHDSQGQLDTTVNHNWMIQFTSAAKDTQMPLERRGDGTTGTGVQQEHIIWEKITSY